MPHLYSIEVCLVYFGRLLCDRAQQPHLQDEQEGSIRAVPDAGRGRHEGELYTMGCCYPVLFQTMIFVLLMLLAIAFGSCAVETWRNV